MTLFDKIYMTCGIDQTFDGVPYVKENSHFTDNSSGISQKGDGTRIYYNPEVEILKSEQKALLLQHPLLK